MKNQFEQSFLSELKNKLSQKIQDEDDQQYILQKLKKMNDKKLTERIINKEFKTIEQFFDIKKECEMESQTNEGNHNQVQIRNLFEQYQSLNKEVDKEIYNQLCQVYNSILKPHSQDQADFDKNPTLVGKDLVVLCNKVKQHFTFYPKPVQLLSVIELYNHKQQQGRLAEIYTGEGKTLIIAMLAILLCIKKQINVDIVTSSPVLAIRDAKELEKFYKLFNITVAHNIRESQNSEEMSKCYQSQVIYGDSHSFQADILRHEYQKLRIMGDRKTEYVIVDEVDSMLIDGNSSKTQISSSTPGMHSPTKVLSLIWHQLFLAEPNSSNKKFFFQDGNNLYEIDLEEHLHKTVQELIQKVLKGALSNYQLDYVQSSLKTWIKNAIFAKYELQENVNYVLDPDVRITDHLNTGVIHQNNTQWENGLHQFIQLKHNLPVSPLRISTNYLSNVGFFRKYQIILGLTGTLGSQLTQNLLASSYNLDCVFLPPHKKRLFQEYQGKVIYKKKVWLEEILKVVQQEIDKNRSVLIINQTIKDVDDVSEYLATQSLSSITYKDNKKDLKKDIKPKEIIVATNLAGRGTDLITNEELDRNGGLHVIMTFLPRNIRIQQQGFGRTSRQGKPGTAQLILQLQDLQIGNIDGIKNLNDAIDFYKKQKQKMDYQLFDVLIYFRDKNEKYHIDNMKKEMERLYNEDKCFQTFQDSIKNIDREQNQADFQVVEELWGMYLQRNYENGLKEEEVKEIVNTKNIQNSKHHTLQGIKENNVKLLSQGQKIDDKDKGNSYNIVAHDLEHRKQLTNEQAIKYLLNSRAKVEQDKQITDLELINLSFQKVDVKFLSKTEEIDLTIPKVTQDSKIPNSSQNNNQEQKTTNKNNNQEQKTNQNNNQQKTNQTNYTYTQKLINQKKVLQKIINNIDHLIETLKIVPISDINISWINTIDMDQSEQCIKDQQEIVEDGPFPKLAIIKFQENSKWWEYLGLLCIGASEIILGSAACAFGVFTFGVTFPLGAELITQGIQDAMVSMMAYWQGININWEVGQKTLEMIASCFFTMTFKMKENLKLTNDIITSFKKISLAEYLIQIPPISKNQLANAYGFLEEEDITIIQNLRQTLILILSKTIEKDKEVIKQERILELAKEIINDQEKKKKITKSQATEICSLVETTLSSFQDDPLEFENKYCEFAQKYIKLKINNCVQNKNENLIKKNFVSLCIQGGERRFEIVKNDIQMFELKKKELQGLLNTLEKNLQECFFKDKVIQKSLFAVEILMKLSGNKKDFQQQITNEVLSNFLSQQYKQQYQTNKIRLEQQIQSNPQDINYFYKHIMQPSYQNAFQTLFQNWKEREPLELQLEFDYSNVLIENKKKIEGMQKDIEEERKKLIELQKSLKGKGNSEILYFNQRANNFEVACQQLNQKIEEFNEIQKNKSNLVTIINYLKNIKMINDDGITFSPNFQEELNKYMIREQFKPHMKEILLKTMMNSLKQIQKTDKDFEQSFKNAIQQEIIDKYLNKIIEINLKAEEIYRKLRE